MTLHHALTKIAEPTPAVAWLLRAGPIAAKLNADARNEIHQRGGRA
jgi:hypothetical protein